MKHYKLVLGLCLSALLTACSFAASKPTVILTSPASGTPYQAGDQVQIQSSSADPSGIVRVELFVDGNLVRSDAPPGGQSQTQFKVIQTWKATTSGAHTLTVRATNVNGAVGEAAITVNVQEQAAQNLTVTPIGIIPTATSGAPSDTPVAPTGTNTTTPTASDTPTTASPTATSTNTLPPCTNNSQFIADVTIPDGTVVAAGRAFVKTWRVRNSGSCAWSAGYSIVRVATEQLGAPSSSPVPTAAPGTVVDISLAMVAPAASGPHSGAWRLRAPDGIFFGTDLTIVFSVPGTPTPTPTRSRTPTSTPTRTSTSTPTATATATVAATQVVNQGSVPSGMLRSVTAACPAGARVTGGGYNMSSNLSLHVYYNGAIAGNGWQVSAANSSSSSQFLIAYAVCVSGAAGTTSVLDKQVLIAAGTSVTNTTACPAGTTVTGGGFGNDIADLEVYTTGQFGNGWTTIAKNNGGSSRFSTSYAICYNGAGASSSRVQAQVTVAANSVGGVNVACPAGTLVTGGGFGTNLGATVYASTPRVGNGWNAQLKNPTGITKPLIVYATCVDFP